MVLLRPTYLIDGDVTDISLDQLENDGIKGLIFDLDSTLLAPHSGRLTPECETWLDKARNRFQVAVVSNNKNDPYIDQVREHLRMPVLHRARKPSTKLFMRVLQTWGFKASEVAVVGDRPLTDVLGGFRAGMKTVLVYPLKTQREPRWVKWFRRLERCVIKP
jgi:HAD superfamily phosphatase (TIGR01668 family)